MIQLINKFFVFLFLLIPLSLISGPAVPDLTITFGGIFGLILISLNYKNENIFKNKFIIISFIFWLGLILISFFAINKLKSLQDSIIFLRYLLIPICCYFIFFKKKEIISYLLLIVFILVVLVSLDTLFQFFNYSSKNGFGKDLLGFKSDWYGRLTGPFGDELIPGSYVSKFGLIGFLYLLINEKLSKNIVLQIFYLSIVLVVCFVSGERMAFAIFSLALLILFFLLQKHRFVILGSIIFGFMCIFTIYKLHPFYNDYKIIESTEFHQGLKIEKKFDCKEGSDKVCTKLINVQPRFFDIIKNFKTSAYGEIYLLSFKMFKDNPITGVGINNFKQLCIKEDKYQRMMVNYDCASHPHNTYIQWLTEGGITIFFLFILYLIYLFDLIVKNVGEREYKIISFVILLILFWPIMSTGSLIKNWYGVSVFYIIGVCMCISTIKKKY